MSYSTIKTGLDQIASDIASEANRIAQGKAYLTMANNNLNGFPAKYANLVTEIQAMLVSEADGPAAILANDELTKLVSEFTSLQEQAGNLVTAINSI